MISLRSVKFIPTINQICKTVKFRTNSKVALRMSPFSELESQIVGWVGWVWGLKLLYQPMDVTGGGGGNPHALQYHPLKLTNSENMIRETAFKPMLLFCS